VSFNRISLYKSYKEIEKRENLFRVYGQFASSLCCVIQHAITHALHQHSVMHLASTSKKKKVRKRKSNPSALDVSA
jgi:hypothetical protein